MESGITMVETKVGTLLIMVCVITDLRLWINRGQPARTANPSLLSSKRSNQAIPLMWKVFIHKIAS
jgi:hypothetical protein